MKAVKNQGANKDAKIYVGRSTTVHNLLFFAHTLRMSYLIKTLLLATYSASSIQPLCFVDCHGQKRNTKVYNKELCPIS